MSFLPEVVAATGGSDYTALQLGENRLRIVSEKVIHGWTYFTEDGQRVHLREEPKGKPANMRLKGKFGDEKVKLFWAATVYNYDTKQVELFKFEQAGIQNGLKTLAADPDWGMPNEYSIKVYKKVEKVKGEDKTSYSVVPGKVAALTDEVKTAVAAKPVNLDALFTGGNPFDSQPKPGAAPTPEQKQTQADDDNDLPF
jgi:hypothetical protein